MSEFSGEYKEGDEVLLKKGYGKTYDPSIKVKLLKWADCDVWIASFSDQDNFPGSWYVIDDWYVNQWKVDKIHLGKNV